MIKALQEEDPALYSAFVDAQRSHDAISHSTSNNGLYPLCGRGRINTFAIFAETNRMIVRVTGRVGCIVPSGIATDDTTKLFFADLMKTQSLVSLYDFENREGLFPAVDSRMKFCLLTLTGGQSIKGGADFIFFAHNVEDLAEENRHFTLTATDLALLNPNTRTCPIFRGKKDARLAKAIYVRVPVLINESNPDGNPWGISFKQGLFNMASDSGLFRTHEQLEAEGWQLERNIFCKDEQIYLPLYSPFAPSGPNYLNFQLPVERRPQSQPLEDVFL